MRRYLTKSPDLEASIELLSIIKTLCHTDKVRFMASFDGWQIKWSDFLKERYIEKKTGKSR